MLQNVAPGDFWPDAVGANQTLLEMFDVMGDSWPSMYWIAFGNKKMKYKIIIPRCDS